MCLKEYNVATTVSFYSIGLIDSFSYIPIAYCMLANNTCINGGTIHVKTPQEVSLTHVFGYMLETLRQGTFFYQCNKDLHCSPEHR